MENTSSNSIPLNYIVIYANEGKYEDSKQSQTIF
jgi:hypothetical protein